MAALPSQQTLHDMEGQSLRPLIDHDDVDGGSYADNDDDSYDGEGDDIDGDNGSDDDDDVDGSTYGYDDGDNGNHYDNVDGDNGSDDDGDDGVVVNISI